MPKLANGLGRAPRHWQCEECGFDLHSGLTPDDLPDERCPKCRASWWAKVPPVPPAIAGDVIDEHELAVARRKAI